MSSLLWFNPHNDLALAVNTARYTPPANAARLAWAGRMLPLWYGRKSDVVLANCVSYTWLDKLRSDFEIGTEIFDGKVDKLTACSPWGWSVDARSVFKAAGVPCGLLPSDDALDRMRALSHRRLTVEISNEIRRRLTMNLPPVPVEVFSVDECLRNVARFEGKAFVKLPYSSTGRGVVDVSGMSSSAIAKKVEGMINRQGSVMIEKALDKQIDFAMLFHAKNGAVAFIGYSAFVADNGFSYSGNLIMPDYRIKTEYIGRFVSTSTLDDLEAVMPQLLSELLKNDYEGYFGVDMLVYRDESGKYEINPCVELNLRMTMGIVAHVLGERFVAPGFNAMMKVGYGRDSVERGVPVIENGRLTAGTLSLIEPDPYFAITLEIV